jgi:L-phenylalanine/L-methionine N-acetyltransferase
MTMIRPQIRMATTQDASSLLAYMHGLVSEVDNNVPLLLDELPSVEKQAQFIESVLVATESALFIAVVDGGIVGRLDINGFKRASLAHVVSLGVSVDAEFRRQGIGSILVKQGLSWILDHPKIKRVELEVHVRNLAAIQLYERFGFKQEGRYEKRLFQHGHFFDTLRMAKLVN